MLFLFLACTGTETEAEELPAAPLSAIACDDDSAQDSRGLWHFYAQDVPKERPVLVYLFGDGPMEGRADTGGPADNGNTRMYLASTIEVWPDGVLEIVTSHGPPDADRCTVYVW